ncbi:hypothetical protein MHBO_002899 [Bonamia ostreae]|uniref:Uncharacterized protein n=1 Tax=Bonamia ostreae TaxID=126728 RepID=A0ABV2ANX6_9EUKA
MLRNKNFVIRKADSDNIHETTFNDWLVVLGMVSTFGSKLLYKNYKARILKKSSKQNIEKFLIENLPTEYVDSLGPYVIRRIASFLVDRNPSEKMKDIYPEIDRAKNLLKTVFKKAKFFIKKLCFGFLGASISSIYSLISIGLTGITATAISLLYIAVYQLSKQKKVKIFSDEFLCFSLMFGYQFMRHFISQRVYLFCFMGYRIGISCDNVQDVIFYTRFICEERLQLAIVAIDSIDFLSLG